MCSASRGAFPSFPFSFLAPQLRVPTKSRALFASFADAYAMKTLKPVRIAKIALVALIGLYALLVGYNNIVDYGSNFEFVRHVLLMDTTFPGNALRGRAIESADLHRSAYALIIAIELICGAACLIGAFRLAAKFAAPAADFDRARGWAVAGLTIGFVLYFFGFMTVGAEWFLMWQSHQWNGQQAAFRVIVCIALVLLFVCQPTPEES